MTTVHSPTAGRRRLRNALRRARDAAGLTQERVAEEMDWSLSKVIRIEAGGVGISTSDLRQLLLLYRIDDPDQVAELVELARIGRQRPWWTRYKDIVPGAYLSYIGLEDESSAIRCVIPVGLPGLLQTPDFARAVVEATWLTRLEAGTVRAVRPTPQEVAERVEMRIIRQQNILRREHPPQITAVLDEAVLWRQIGGPEVLTQQLRHLVELGRRPHITLRVLPFTTSMINLVSPFVILEFPDPADEDVVYLEGEEAMVDSPAGVSLYRQIFERVSAAALPEDESLALISRVADEIGGSRPRPGSPA